MRITGVLLGLLVPLVACSAGMNNYQRVEEKTKYAPEDLLEVSVRAVEELGHPARRVDRETYQLETREKQIAVSSVPALSYKYSFRISTAGGKLSIDSTCTENSSLSREKFEDCGDERPDRVLKEQERLHKDILARAAERAKKD
jgi:hypothetical protein